MSRRIASIALLFMLLLGACSPGTDPGPCASIECFENRGVLVVESLRHHLRDTTYFSSAARASFTKPMGPYVGFPVEAGRVRLNGVDLVFDDFREYRLADSTLPLRVAPALNVWTILGSREIPAFTDTATVSATRPVLLQPRAGDTVSIRGGLTARWHGSGGDSGRYQLRVVHPGDPDDRRTITYRDLPDSASVGFPIDGKDLAPGSVSIELVETHTHYTWISEGVRVTNVVVLIERVAVVLVE